MIFVFLGPPGTGKGTISNYLVEKKDYKHISTGDIFREIIKDDGEKYKEIREKINKGELINDELTFKLLREKIDFLNLKKFNVILDGFPRNINQSKMLEEYLQNKDFKIDKVFYFASPDSEILKRISSRLICTKCNRVYNSDNNKPVIEGKCDIDGEELIVREDDKPLNVLSRIETYRNSTEPLVLYYEKKGILKEFDVNDSLEKVLKNALRKIK